MFFWHSLAISIIQQMLAIWSLIPLPFLNSACTSGSSRFKYRWSLPWRILSKILLAYESVQLYGSLNIFGDKSIIVQLLSRVQLFATPWTAACQASLSFTISQSLLKLMSLELVMPSNHLICCHPLLLPPLIFPSIRVFSNESVLPIRWPKYWKTN